MALKRERYFLLSNLGHILALHVAFGAVCFCHLKTCFCSDWHQGDRACTIILANISQHPMIDRTGLTFTRIVFLTDGCSTPTSSYILWGGCCPLDPPPPCTITLLVSWGKIRQTTTYTEGPVRVHDNKEEPSKVLILADIKDINIDKNRWCFSKAGVRNVSSATGIQRITFNASKDLR